MNGETEIRQKLQTSRKSEVRKEANNNKKEIGKKENEAKIKWQERVLKKE
jgi:hypothetical protein